MKKILLVIIISIFISLNLLAEWTNIRNSSFTPDNEIYFRYESTVMTGAEHRLYYYLDEEWQFVSPDNVNNNTFEGVVPFANIDPLPLSFRIDATGDIYIIPGFTHQAPSSLQEMSTMSDYTVNPDIPQHLNIAGEKMLFSDDRLYFAFTNFGGGFPVSDGTFGPFYSYTINLWYETAESVPEYVFTLLYTVNIAPFINPGLFKIDAQTEELVQIGFITHDIDPETNTLYLSCLWDDLMTDPDFAAAYSPDEPLIISSMTQKIEDLGQIITIMDEGNEHKVYLNDLMIEPFVNNLPQLDNIIVEQGEDTTTITLDYYDIDGHFPLISEIELDTGNTLNLIADSQDFSGTVSYSCHFSDIWNEGTIRFSDNESDLVEHFVYSLSASETIMPLPSTLEIYPNPFSMRVHQHKDLNLHTPEGTYADIEFFNLKGQRLLLKRDLKITDNNITLAGKTLHSALQTSGIFLVRVVLYDSNQKSENIIFNRFLYLR